MKEFLLVDAPHPSTIDEELLLRHCKLEFGRGTGPGGQRRNKVATACEIVHEPTGVMAHAAEMRKQADNRRVALRRLR
ncbi:MAG: peptide chain release factor-like protein, partial [Planctomycetota bacterium]|nr:peptide chain release factor-like protein [Planctomycetota bacterium]